MILRGLQAEREAARLLQEVDSPAVSVVFVELVVWLVDWQGRQVAVMEVLVVGLWVVWNAGFAAALPKL